VDASAAFGAKPSAATVVPAKPPAQILKNFLRLTFILSLVIRINGWEITIAEVSFFAANQY